MEIDRRNIVEFALTIGSVTYVLGAELPFREDGNVDMEALRARMKRLEAALTATIEQLEKRG